MLQPVYTSNRLAYSHQIFVSFYNLHPSDRIVHLLIQASYAPRLKQRGRRTPVFARVAGGMVGQHSVLIYNSYGGKCSQCGFEVQNRRVSHIISSSQLLIKRLLNESRARMMKETAETSTGHQASRNEAIVSLQ